MLRVLVLEDGPFVADRLARMLAHEELEFQSVPCTEAMASVAGTLGFDLVILDISQRVADATPLLRALAHHERGTPVVVVTSRKQVVERIRAAELGLNCVTAPHAMPELGARVRALIQRAPGRTRSKVVYGPLILDRFARRAYLDGEPLHLLPRELAVLLVLLERADGVVSKGEISQAMSNPGKSISGNTIETYVSRLRAKLEPAIRIRTVHRVGYMLEVGVPVRVAPAAQTLK